MAARLKAAINGRAARLAASHLKSIRLGVPETIITMIAFANYSTIAHNHSANHRVRTYKARATKRKLKRPIHEFCVRVHIL
jgi:uncharacterized protein YlzI (FlbEa/FlbD family)